MPRETGGPPPEQENPIERFRQYRDRERTRTDETQRQVAEIQALKYEKILLILEQRSATNANLVHAMNGFLDKLENLAIRGQSDSPLARGIVSRITEYFYDVTDQMYRDDGKRPPDRTKK